MTQNEQILLLGSYGRGNIGDDAFLLAAIELFPNSKIYINSADDSLLPKEAKGRVTTISTTGTKDLKKKFKVFRDVTHIIYCGGDLWVELIGDRFPRQSLYKMALVNIIAKLSGKKVHYIGTGAGKLKGLSLWLARLSARLATNVAVREERTAALLGLPKIKVLTDLTVNLKEYPPHPKPIAKRPEIVGVSLLYYVPDPEKNFPKLLSSIANLLQSLPQKTKIIIFPMLVSKDTPKDDLWAAEQLKKELEGREVTIFESRGINDFITALSQVDILVAARLHANILATLCGTPCLGLAYRPKVAEFFKLSGINEYHLPLTSLDNMEELFERMYNDYAKVTQQFAEARARNLKKRVAYQEFVATHF